MKKHYMCPAVKVQETETELMTQFSAGDTDTTPVHTDDPQQSGSALSRKNSIWDDEE